MLTRSYCAFCGKQMNDRDPAVQHSISGAYAHKSCLTTGVICEGGNACTHREHHHEINDVRHRLINDVVQVVQDRLRGAMLNKEERGEIERRISCELDMVTRK